MKTTFLKFTALLLLAAGSLISCGKENNGPVEIPFTEYSLTGTSAQWTNLGYDDKVIIINSSAALENYLTNTGSGYPAIDFSKQTLLLASGTTTTGIAGIAKKLQQISTRYVLDIEITLNEATFAQEWIVALVTSKLHQGKNVEIIVTLGGDVPFWLCDLNSFERNDTLFVRGEAYLFNDFIPDDIRTKLVQEYERSGYAAWIVYEAINEFDHRDVMVIMSDRGIYNIATLHVYTRGEIGRYYICNYPDFAKEWKVPSTGQKVYYEGKALLCIRQYGSPMEAVYDLGLTILKKK